MNSNCMLVKLFHTGDAEKIINHALYGPAQNQSYNRLAEFTDTFGSRIAGSQNLENAIGKNCHLYQVIKSEVNCFI